MPPPALEGESLSCVGARVNTVVSANVTTTLQKRQRDVIGGVITILEKRITARP
jgi:hypothetical protein